MKKEEKDNKKNYKKNIEDDAEKNDNLNFMDVKVDREQNSPIIVKKSL